MSAWGKTGRVTLEEGWIFGPKIQTVSVDGARVGQVGYWTDIHFWYGRPIDGSFAGAGTSLDAAVLWVLRRVDPALWRQERGAWLVRKRKPGEWTVRSDGTERDYAPEYPWLVVDPSGVPRNGHASIFDARWDAHRRAQGATR